MYFGIAALSPCRNYVLPHLNEHTRRNSAPCDLGRGYATSTVATYPSSASSLVGTVRSRTRRPQLCHDALLASSPLVFGPLSLGMAGLEMAAAGYFWMDRSTILLAASLLF